MGKKQKTAKKKVNAYLKYTGIAFQLAAIILLGIFGGQKLDELCGFEVPIITILLLLLLFTGFMYRLYLDLTKK